MTAIVIKSVSPIVMIYTLFLNTEKEESQKRGFLKLREPSCLGLVTCGQKSVSTGVPMLESSILFGIIRQTPAVNQLL